MRRENISPKAIKNAAIIRIIVSVGPVSVFVISGVILTGFTAGATAAESVYDTHSL